ncbi:sulfite exporter TauE/SafE family protein [Pseudoprimorskyibacter insulae]|uniref:Probable membrane transporter protein n=1 Tax=Pseudoprimorskyibacter insulae TaxID=1695997 RepID=A0A2R8AP01_9RHOB|nr:sulfite exporter TauE/SafE family protein [Pseudoprimorskyibacter insulae]SPF77710.1 hypothetical protein PRI8871_00294 [Pseudoprimorskyibacter insulae]
MSIFSTIDSTVLIVAAVLIGLAGGFVKGAVGFALPMILISGLSTFLPPEVALAGLILPTVVTNGVQALRHGLAEALASVKRFKVFLAVGAVMLLASSQLVTILPGRWILLAIGVPVTGFAVLQLTGWQAKRQENPSRVLEVGIAAFAGFVGGISGVWGPPTVAYLTILGTEKKEHMRVQGVIYGLGAVLLVFAHLKSGVLNAQTVPFSVAMLVPVLAGMWIGMRFHDRLDAVKFKRMTLAILLIAGLNLIRKGLMG